jgi:pyridoxamine 5'-phosphate oxidase
MPAGAGRRRDLWASAEAIVASVIDDRVTRLREEYETEGLHESDMAPDPFQQFEEWYEAAEEARLHQPNAFVLATSTPDGKPSARAVLMKGFSPDGLVFYSNRASRKGSEIDANPHVAATFMWLPLHRQVRFEGMVEMVPEQTADIYFASRPPGAQIAAHASAQSSVIPDRETLERRFTELQGTLTGDVPRPAVWTGWRLAPSSAEFWQGRKDRLHDRIRYLGHGGSWRLERLAP